MKLRYSLTVLVYICDVMYVRLVSHHPNEHINELLYLRTAITSIRTIFVENRSAYIVSPQVSIRIVHINFLLEFRADYSSG